MQRRTDSVSLPLVSRVAEACTCDLSRARHGMNRTEGLTRALERSSSCNTKVDVPSIKFIHGTSPVNLNQLEDGLGLHGYPLHGSGSEGTYTRIHTQTHITTSTHTDEVSKEVG